MTRICPGCGSETVPDARFCRKCGAPLRATGQHGDSETISPQAATIPLRDEGRTTDGLSREDPRAGAPDTSRVSRADMDSILQQAARSTDFDPNKTIAQTPPQQTLADAARDAATQSGTLPPTQSSPPAPPPQRPPSQPLSEEDLMKTRPAMNDDFDEELTVTVPRPFTGDVKPVQVQHVPTTGPLGGGPSAGQAAQSTPTGQQQPTPPARKKGPWVVVAVVCAVLLLFAAVGAWLALNYLRRPATDVSTTEPTAPATADDRALAQEKLIEAESLLATGDLNGALERLREAVRLDPQNSRAHRRLGDILLETGARREAIEELRTVTQLEPNDFTAWRTLASAQLAEGLPADAVESYKRLVALTGETDPHDMLSYADALRLAGRTDEARAIYQRLSTATVADVAAQARQHLAELASASTPTPQPTRDQQTQTDNSDATQQTAAVATPPPTPAPTVAPTPQPTPQITQAQLSPADRYRRGVELWGSNRSAAVTEFLAAARAGNPDANYYLGLNLVEGRDLRNLKRAEVVAALGYFQRAQSGSNGSRARQYVQQLEREYDRIRSQQ